MFQFPRLPPHTYVFSVQSWPITTRGFPHSDIHASRLAYSSAWHFGVRPVLLRLLAPRHPPCALPNFTCRNAAVSHYFTRSQLPTVNMSVDVYLHRSRYPVSKVQSGTVCKHTHTVLKSPIHRTRTNPGGSWLPQN